MFWYRRIVSFDQESQFETLKAVKEATKNSGKQLRAAFERVAEQLRLLIATPWNARKIGFVAALIALIAGVTSLAKRLRFSIYNLSFSKRKRRGDAVRFEASRWLARLRDVETRAIDGDEDNDHLVHVVRDLQRLRYGARETWSDPAETFRRARKALREAKRRRAESPPYR